jgi:hypothetical protein
VKDSLARGPAVQDQLPTDVDLQEAGISFRLPGDVALTGGWNQLETQESTGVWISATRQELRVVFSPPLLVDAQWPLSNVEWSGFTWDFAAGRMSHVDVHNTQIGIPVDGQVRDAVTTYVTGLVSGSVIARGGYDPMKDPNLAATLRKIQGNFNSKGAAGKGGELKPEQLTNFGANATIRMGKAIDVSTAGGGVSMPAGATISLGVSVDGNGATIGRTAPNIQSASLSSNDLTLLSGGKPIARLRSMRIDRGGAVDVTDFEPLGKLAEVGAGESLIRLFGILAATQGADPRLAGGGDINPRVVNGVAEREMEKGLTAAVRQLVTEHHDAIPGVDLLTLFGMGPARS